MKVRKGSYLADVVAANSSNGLKNPPQYVRAAKTDVAVRLALKLRSESINDVPKLMASTAINIICGSTSFIYPPFPYTKPVGYSIWGKRGIVCDGCHN